MGTALTAYLPTKFTLTPFIGTTGGYWSGTIGGYWGRGGRVPFGSGGGAYLRRGSPGPGRSGVGWR